jgi:hypothetical protein
MLDYVRFQLTATPMAALLKEKGAAERERLIISIAAAAAKPRLVDADGWQTDIPAGVFRGDGLTRLILFEGREVFSDGRFGSTQLAKRARIASERFLGFRRVEKSSARAGSLVVADEVFDGYGIEKASCRFGPEGLGTESVQGRRNLL